jgi:Ca2+-binding RTX toxin-like protein
MALVIGKAGPGDVNYVLINGADGVTDGSDQIVGTDGVDHIYAGGGQDIIKGGGGADLIDGGAGRDGVSYEDSDVGVDVSLVTGKGHHGTAEGDTLISIEDLYGSKYDDKLVGDAGDNLLSGADGNDTLKGGGGADVLKGGDGNDVMQIDGPDDRAYGGAGNDTVIVDGAQGYKIDLRSGFIDFNPFVNGIGPHNRPYAEGGYGPGFFPHAPGDQPQLTDVENVIGTKFNDAIYGNDDANNLSGGDGDDVLSGKGGDDIISGGNGKDLIFGGTGADTLTGGQDADTFVFSSVDASLMQNGKPQDVITDFQTGIDHIDLTAFNLQNGQFLELDNQNIGGTNCSVIGVDANGNHQFDEGEFAVAVKMAPGTTLHLGDFLF